MKRIKMGQALSAGVPTSLVDVALIVALFALLSLSVRGGFLQVPSSAKSSPGMGTRILEIRMDANGMPSMNEEEIRKAVSGPMNAVVLIHPRTPGAALAHLQNLLATAGVTGMAIQIIEVKP